jgi:hypothetical protein
VIETELRTLLVGDAAVNALVSGRVSADRMAQDQPMPFVVFTRTGTEPVTDVSGAVLASRTFLEVQCWAQTRAAAESLADACQTAIRGAVKLVTNRAAVYDPDMDVEGTVLSVEWWA